MNIDYLSYFKKLGLNVNLDVLIKEKLSNLLDSLMCNFELTDEDKILLSNDDKYFLTVKKNMIAITADKTNVLKKSWQIKLLNTKKDNVAINVCLIIEDKLNKTKYLNIIYKIDKYLSVKTNIAISDNNNTLTNNKMLRKKQISDLLKNKKLKNQELLKLNKLTKINQEHYAALDLNIIIDTHYLLDKLNIDTILVDSKYYNKEEIINYFKNNINLIDRTEIYDILVGYEKLLNDGYNTYLNKPKEMKKNKCA